MGKWLRARSRFRNQLGLLVFDAGQVYFLIDKAGIYLKDTEYFPLSHAHVRSLHLLSRILKVKINIKSYQLIQHL